MRRHTELQHMVIVSLRKQPQTFLIKDLSFQLTQLSAGLTFPELIIQITFTHMFSAFFCFLRVTKSNFQCWFQSLPASIKFDLQTMQPILPE